MVTKLGRPPHIGRRQECDLPWPVGSVDRLLDWERLCTPVQHQEGIASVCQYDQRRFSGTQAAMITRVIDLAGFGDTRVVID